VRPPLAHRQQRISVLANQRRSDQLRRPEQWLAKQPLSGFFAEELVVPWTFHPTSDCCAARFATFARSRATSITEPSWIDLSSLPRTTAAGSLVARFAPAR
jgi:hypothetical protein